MARTKKIVSKKKTAPKVEKKTTPRKKTVTKKTTTKKKVLSFKDSILKKLNSNPLVGSILKIVTIVIGIFLVVVLADYAVQYVRNERSVAVVNGRRISKAEWHRVLEKVSGQAVAESLINDSIVMLEAKKADVKVTQEEIDKRVEQIKEDIGGEDAFNTAMKAANYELKDLEDNIRIDMYYTKLIGPSINYSDDDVKAFFEQYSNVLFAKETDALKEGEKLDYETFKEKTTEYYIAQMVGQEKQNWLLNKTEEYSIQDNSREKPVYKFFGTINQITRNLFNRPAK